MIDTAFALLAHTAPAAPATATGEFLWMAGGRHTITCHQDGNPAPVTATVLVDPAGAAAVQSQFARLSAQSAHRPYCDFNHKDEEASFWPTAFAWRDQPQPGIYVSGEWSDQGKAALAGKAYRSFSPRFYVDDEKANPARLVDNPHATLNFGGLVNDPAFKANRPLWAKQAAAPATQPPAATAPNPPPTTMTATETAAMTAADPGAAAALTAANAEINRLKAEALAGRQATAKAALKAAIQRGALAPQATDLHTKYEALICQDAGNIFLLEQLPANPALAATTGAAALTAGDAGTGHQRPAAIGGYEVKPGMNQCLKGYVALQAKNAAMPYGHRTAEDKKALALQAAMIYREEMAGKNWPVALNAIELAAHDGGKALMGSDYSGSAGLGVLNGTLVAQRTLELFKYEFPLFDMLHTDFSEMPAALNQDIVTRIINIPAVQLYDPTLNADGEPNGWRSVTPPSTSDVKITLSKLAGVPIRFGIDTIAQTPRRLFDEQAEAGSYALGKYFVELIYALLTPANYNSYATANNTNVPTAYPTFPKSALEFGRNSLVDAGAAFDAMAVPTKNRFALLNPQFHGQLEKDPSLIYFAAQRAPELVSGDGLMPRMARWQPVLAPNLAGSGANVNATPNLVGFLGHKAAIAVGSRLINDYTQSLPGANIGAVTTITNPDIGISCNLIQFVNHQAGYAEWLLAAILGAAVGDKRGGLCLTSQ